jgi:nicotinate phosphoribosyltransferase
MKPLQELVLLTDLYELTMVQAFWAEDMLEPATFSLFSRTLPVNRNFLLAAGLNEALGLLEQLEFSTQALRYLASLEVFEPEFLKWLSGWRFQGEVWALPEGTPFFANEPLLEVSASLPEAQLIESLILNQVHLPTLLASKAVRVAYAAQGRTVVDFGLRRTHGYDAALKAARAFYVAGIDATSNVLAGREYGIPVAGTMAHSYVQAYGRELDAFRDFATIYAESVLLIDTYDVVEGARNVVRLAAELGSSQRIRGVRIDSGDLGPLAKTVRKILDEAGLTNIEIFVSGGLDEFDIDRMVRDGYPIDGFGVGTSMGVSEDAPALDVAYKLTAYAGKGRLKLSRGKSTLPCRKQAFRELRDGRAAKDWLGIFDENASALGEPLLELVMQNGKRVGASLENVNAARRRAEHRLDQLPAALKRTAPADPPYRVDVTDALQHKQQEVVREIERGH